MMRTKQGTTALATSSVTVGDSNEQTQVKPRQVTTSSRNSSISNLSISQTINEGNPLSNITLQNSIWYFIFFFDNSLYENYQNDNSLSSVVGSIINDHCFPILNKLKQASYLGKEKELLREET